MKEQGVPWTGVKDGRTGGRGTRLVVVSAGEEEVEAVIEGGGGHSSRPPRPLVCRQSKEC